MMNHRPGLACAEAARQSVGWCTCIACFVCVYWGGGRVYKSITNMLRAHSHMCTCMQPNKKVKVKKSGTLTGEATGEFNNMRIFGAVIAGVPRAEPLSPRRVAGST